MLHTTRNAILLCQHRRLRHYEVTVVWRLHWNLLSMLSLRACWLNSSTITLQYESSIQKWKKKTKISVWKVGIKWSRVTSMLKQLARKRKPLECAKRACVCNSYIYLFVYVCYFSTLLFSATIKLRCDTVALTIYCHD